MKVTFEGGFVETLASTLTLTCGATTTGLTHVQPGGFPTTVSLNLIAGTATQDVAFPAFTTSEGCAMTAYALDDDNLIGNGLNAPAGATLPATCGGVTPC